MPTPLRSPPRLNWIPVRSRQRQATRRLKRSGMRWRHRGGQAILTLRPALQRSRVASAWALLSETHRQEVVAPDNVVPLPQTRAA